MGIRFYQCPLSCIDRIHLTTKSFPPSKSAGLRPLGFNSPSRHHFQSRVGRGSHAHPSSGNWRRNEPQNWPCDARVTGRERFQE